MIGAKINDHTSRLYQTPYRTATQCANTFGALKPCFRSSLTTFKPKTIALASRGALAAARLSRYHDYFMLL